MKALQNITLRNQEHPNEREKVLHLAQACWEHGVNLYVKEDEIAPIMHLIDTKGGRPPKLGLTRHTFEGGLTVSQYIAKHRLNITPGIFYDRIRAGWGVEKAINTPKQSNVNKTTMVDGLPLITYCKLHGLKANRVRARIANGWSLEDAINKPRGEKCEKRVPPPSLRYNAARIEAQKINAWKKALKAGVSE